MTTTLRGIVIPADDKTPLHIEEIEQGCQRHYEWLVGGAIRTVRLFRTGCVLYTNRDSRLHAKSFNERATRIMHFHAPLLNPEDIVRGDAFVLGNNDTDAPEELIQVLVEASLLRVEACFSDVWVRQVTTYGTWQGAYTAAIGITEVWEGQVDVRVVPA
jgi:hypothetical protein